MREHMTRIGEALYAVLLVLFLALSCPLAAIAADEHVEPMADRGTEELSRVVRVAFPQQPNMTWTDQSGARSGYAYEFLERIAQYTGWEYEFVPVEGQGLDAVNQARALLEAGDVDLVPGVLSTEENRASFELSNDSYATFESVLQVLSGSVDDSVIDPLVDQRLRIAVIDDAKLIEGLMDYCVNSRIEPDLVLCEDRDQQLGALRVGRADVMLSTSFDESEGVHNIARFAPQSLYFATMRGDNELASTLNGAMASIEQVYPQLEADLHTKYFSPDAKSLVLTGDERALVEAGPIRVGVLTDQPPYQYKGDEGLLGISVDLMDVIAEKTGLRVKYVAAPTYDALDELLAAGEIDVEAGVDCSMERARDRGFSLTQPYVSAPYVLAANGNIEEGSIKGKRLALVASSEYGGQFVGVANRYDSIAACVRAVAKGEADYTYLDEYVVQYFLSTAEFSGVRLVPQTHNPRNVSFGVARAEGGELLLGLLDKAIGSLNETELQSVINSNVLIDQDVGIVDYLKAHALETFLTVTAVLLVILLLVLVIVMQRLRGRAKAAVDFKKRLQLYTLADDYFFEYDFEKKTLMLSHPGHGGSDGMSQFDTYSYDELERRVAQAFDACAGDASGSQSVGAFIEFIGSGRRGPVEMMLPDINGDLHWLRLSVETAVDEADKPVFAVGKIEIIDDEHREKEQLVARAQQDSLTKVLNAATTRQRIIERLQKASDGSAALLVVDVDHFKEVNDTRGHLEGDRVLKSVAQLLKSNFRGSDIVGRPGGDEFMVFMGDAKGSKSLRAKCERVRAIVSQEADEGGRVTVSIGAALTRKVESFDDLYRRADAALYKAKREGRDRYCVDE